LGIWFVLYSRLIGGGGNAIGFNDPLDESNHSKRTALPLRIIDKGQKPADRHFLSCRSQDRERRGRAGRGDRFAIDTGHPDLGGTIAGSFDAVGNREKPDEPAPR
jgi:hypothetical protein